MSTASARAPAASRRSISWPRLHGHVLTVDTRLDLCDQLWPVHASGVADDVDTRHTAAPDEVVAGTRRLDAGHQTHFAAQLAADADAVVVERVEELQHSGLQRRRDPAGAAADIRDAGDGLLADEVLRAIAGRGVKARIESDRRPVEQLEPFHVRVQQSGDRADRERMRHEIEIEAACSYVSEQQRPGAEGILQLEATSHHRAVEDNSDDIAFDRQYPVPIGDAGNAPREPPGETRPIEGV